MLAPGTPAPPFQFESSEGGFVSRDALAGKVAVLYFYPRDNTPGCTIEAQEFRDHLKDFQAAGAEVFGVSRDSIASHCKFRDKYGLTFPLLTDADGAAMAKYQAWGDKVLYGKKITGVIRSTVVIDRNGTIARHWPKVAVKGHAADVLAFVRSLGGGAAREATSGAKAGARSSGDDDKPARAKAGKPAAKPGKPAAKPATAAKKPATATKKPVKAAKPVKKPATAPKKPVKPAKPVKATKAAKKPGKPAALKAKAKKPAGKKPGAKARR